MVENNGANRGRMPDMPQLTQNTSLESVLKTLSKEQREKILSGVDMRRFVKIFEDAEMMRTAEALFANGMNVSATARALYMHRNTLMYRLKVICKKTGLNLQNFDMAVTFRLLHITYNLR